MEEEHKQKNKLSRGDIQKKNSNLVSDDGDVPEPIRIRRCVLFSDETNRKLLLYNFGFLPIVGGIFYILLLAYGN